MIFYVLPFFILLSFPVYAVDFPGSAPQNQNVMKLSATSFPETKFDTTFTERVESMAAGYAPYETVWDENGNCVSGCAYAGMSIATEQKRLEHDTEIAGQKLAAYCAKNPAACAPPSKTGPEPSFSHICYPSNSLVPTNQTLPKSEPLMGMPKITSPCQEKRFLFNQYSSHIALDFSAVIGTPVFAPANGTVIKILANDAKCGNGIILKHAEGLSTIYCHLSDISMVTQGQNISAGCMFAKTGNTGRSTGPHLHYSVRLNGSAICPSQFTLR
jgi:murein DD-endopeptidase MepM/ murein hydrolase activator NlpD